MTARTLKIGLLILCKWCGLFALARLCTRSRLRVLCYHGFAETDEDAWAGGIMMRPDTFARRLRFLADLRYPVLPLEEALAALRAGTLPPAATAITIMESVRPVEFEAFLSGFTPILKACLRRGRANAGRR